MKSKSLDFSGDKNKPSSSGSLFAPKKKPVVSTEKIQSTKPIVPINVESKSSTMKLDLNSKDLDIKEKPPRSRRRKILTNLFLVFISVLLIVGIASYIFVIMPIQRVLGNVNDIKDNASAMAADFESKDLSKVDIYFENIQNDLNSIDAEIARYDFLATLDATKGYYDNFQVGRGILRKSSDLIEVTLPEFKDVLSLTGFKTEEGEVMPVPEVDPSNPEAPVEEEGALTLVMKQLPRYLELYDSMEPQILDILTDVKEINPDYVPNIGGYNIKDSLLASYDFIDDFPAISAQTTGFLEKVPELIGAQDPADYLLILQNETEMRSSGGLLTAWGNLSMDKGEIKDEIFLTDMWNWQYDLWAVGRAMPYNNIYGQNWLMNLGCGGTELRVQDAGIYPDLNRISAMLQDYHDQVQPSFPDVYTDYDYTLILNQAFATNLINIIQPLEVEGYGSVDAEGLYDFIKGETDKNLPNEVRKDIIKAIANASKEKFLNLPIEKFPEVLAVLIGSFQRRDLAIEARNDESMQAYLDKYGMSGRFATEDPGFDGDYFHMNEAQNCSLKLNKFIRDEITQDVYIAENGTITKDVQVKWLQTKVYEPGLEKQYSPSTAFSYRAWTRFFTPKDTKVTQTDGYKASGYVGYYPQNYFDKIMNKQVNDNIVQFDHRRFKEEDPIERRSMNLSLDLPDTINYNEAGKYQMLIQKHPGKSWGEKYIVKVHMGDQETTVEFTLDRDKVLTYKDGIISIDNYDKSLDWLQELVNSIPWDKVKE